MRGGSIKIGARHFWGRGVFVLVISNINIGFQKWLTLPLNYNISLFFYYIFGSNKSTLVNRRDVFQKQKVILVISCKYVLLNDSLLKSFDSYRVCSKVADYEKEMSM